MTDHDVIQRYFTLATAPDLEDYFAQFADDAIAEDEGHLHEGIAAIRAWRTAVPPVSYTPGEIERMGEGYHAVATIAGDFPGSPVDLAFGFVLNGEKITRLTIRPAD